MRLYRTKDLKIDESVLTGESLSVLKQNSVIENDVILAERKNMAYSGTMVTNGRGVGIVVSTGDYTETGKISQSMHMVQEVGTPLTKKISRFSKTVVVLILGLSGITFFVGWYVFSRGIVDVFIEVVALAVAAIPEGLPAAITITLAIGVSYMAKRHAVIRKLPAVETLGSTTVICSDKTGTLTENKMTVTEVYAGNTFHVTGKGYDPVGEFSTDDGKNIQDDWKLKECLLAGIACNDSDLVRVGSKWEARGDPTEVALVTSAFKLGMQNSMDSWNRIDSIPFDCTVRFMATLHQTSDNDNIVYIKGAPESILEMCSYEQVYSNSKTTRVDLEYEKLQKLHTVAEEMAKRGLRVLGFAKNQCPLNTTSCM